MLRVSNERDVAISECNGHKAALDVVTKESLNRANQITEMKRHYGSVLSEKENDCFSANEQMSKLQSALTAVNAENAALRNKLDKAVGDIEHQMMTSISSVSERLNCE